MSLTDDVNTMFAGIFKDMQVQSLRQEKAAAEKDPLKYKLSHVMVNTRYTYYEIHTRKNRRVRFCYSKHRNVAGFFLGWREVITKGQGKRDMWLARRVKRRVKELALRRYNALRKKISKPAQPI